MKTEHQPSGMARRKFLQTGMTFGMAAGFGMPFANPAAAQPQPGRKGMPVVLSSSNGLPATARAMEMIRSDADTLDAVVAGVNLVEEDPNDRTVGYGGLPNERGEVELDACVMHGPTWRAGAVGALRGVKTPSKVAKLVMERTDHVFLVGAGALDFAKAYGFKETDLLTDEAREAWIRWKENLSSQDDWLGEEERGDVSDRPTGTITCLGLNERGELSGVTTTSGLAFKIPGRVGDSPLIGAGLYVDNEVGACGATGRGEAVILTCGSRIVVENMRHGMGPQEALMDVLKRISRQTVQKRLLDEQGRPNFNVTFYALAKNGEYAAGSLYQGGEFAVHDGRENQKLETVYLYEKKA